MSEVTPPIGSLCGSSPGGFMTERQLIRRIASLAPWNWIPWAKQICPWAKFLYRINCFVLVTPFAGERFLPGIFAEKGIGEI
jgi:hypothetical protein